MILVTKKGLKLWGSGLLSIVTVGGLAIITQYLGVAEASLGVQALYYLVLFPMAVGAAQRWFWDELR